MAADLPKLELRQVRMVFDDVEAVKGSNLTIHQGEFLSLLGPSGCGKSTTLAMIAGFLSPTSGEILIDGRLVNDVPPQKRRIGLVFQDYAVFTKLSVRKNLLFGLEAQGVPRRERERTLAEFVEKLGLGELLAARGRDLNMSEMQRVALGRVLVTKPELLLLDEPMSNLDAQLRASLRGELKRIQKDLAQTVLYVTHDQVEAMSMSDRIAVMDMGEILQTGSPDAIFHRPANRFVAEFIGDPAINIVPCRVESRDGGSWIATELHDSIRFNSAVVQTGPYHLGIRSHHVLATLEAHPGGAKTKVKFVENYGSEHILYAAYGDALMTVSVDPGFAQEGDTVFVSFDRRYIHLIDLESGLTIPAADRESAA